EDGNSNGGGDNGGDGSAAPGTTTHDQGPGGGGGNDGNGDQGGSGGGGSGDQGGSGGGGNDGNGDQGGSGGGSGDQGGSGGGNSGPGGGDDDGNGPFIQMGPERLDVRQLASLSIVPDTSPGGDAFTIGHATGMRNDNFSSFSDFIVQLSSDLASGDTAVIALTASGHFDASSATFTASNIAVLVSN
ncbi:MAG: hypothetical protein ACRETR_07605, partial [Steroidobacteraceae bacterium]